MHWIQTHILEQLSFVETARNRDLRPDSVESNLFQYHLNRLVEQGYVARAKHKYTLGVNGLSWADRYSTQLKQLRRQPKIITIIGIYNHRGEYVLIRKPLQPFVNTYFVPSGKLHEGEPIEQAAYREAREKLGIDVPKLQYTGIIRVHVRQQGITITDYVGFLFTASLSPGCKLPKGAVWQKPAHTCKTPVAPGTIDTLDSLCSLQPYKDVVIEF